ncbi:MAG: helix-turn-helix transcriptional regulator [Bacteriovorax sp.]|nr:helix-turn-helix transcriptional regulator [Bacteriovorax sp.]
MIYAKKILEQYIGPPTVGMLLRAYRNANDITIQKLALTLGVTKGYISNIETGKKEISLDKALNICKALGEVKEVYARVWFEEQARNAGLDFKKVVNR